MNTDDQILSGVRVVELSSGLSGPVATQILAEAGADVIKVERPAGDPIRIMHPAAFATWNRSKRSVVLDLHQPTDRQSLHELLITADVFVHDLKPSVATAWGFDDVSIQAAFPRLIISAVTGFPAGDEGAERPQHDLLVQARGGLMDYQAGWRDGPFVWRFLAPSWFAALLAVTGIAARLFHRHRTGQGGAAHTTLLQGLRLAENMNWVQAERPPASIAGGPAPAMRIPQVAMYQCADDKWIQILNPADRFDLTTIPLVRSSIEMLGLSDVPFDAGVLMAAMTQAPSDEWLAAIRAVDVAVELIAPLGHLLDHEETAANGYVVDVNDPMWGRTRQAGPPFQTDPPMQVRGPAPMLGQHTAKLTELGDGPPTAPSTSSTAASGTSSTAGSGAAPTRPLDGITVVDVGAFLAGPLAPMLLADLGADVIKIEPVRGDPVRGWRDEFYIACNRGKRGVALDVASDDGRQVMQRLIERADVVHHNMRSDAAAKLGIDEQGVRRTNPRAILGHVSAYGMKGPRANWPGYDSVFQAMSGWNIELAGEGNPPLFNHLGNLDMLTGTASAAATILALYHRERTGHVGASRCSLLNTATFTNSETLLTLDDHELAAYPRLDREQTGLGPGYRIYRAQDAWIAIVALEDVHRRALHEVAGVDDDAALVDAFSGRGAADLLAALDAGGVPAELVREEQWRVVFNDEEALRTGLVTSYPQKDWGEMQQFGAFWNLGDLDLRLDRACPAVGEHSVEVLRELGYDDKEIERLAENGVVGGADLQPAT